MNLKKVLGVVLMVAPIIGTIGVVLVTEGAKAAIGIWSVALLGTLMVVGGIRLLGGTPVLVIDSRTE